MSPDPDLGPAERAVYAKASPSWAEPSLALLRRLKPERAREDSPSWVEHKARLGRPGWAGTVVVDTAVAAVAADTAVAADIGVAGPHSHIAEERFDILRLEPAPAVRCCRPRP
jgi:hypothetical protein